MFSFFGGKKYFTLDLGKDRLSTTRRPPRNAKIILSGKDRDIRHRMQNGGVSASELQSLCFEVEAVANWVLAMHRQRSKPKKATPTVTPDTAARLDLGSAPAG
jgi:hypothetical protein